MSNLFLSYLCLLNYNKPNMEKSLNTSARIEAVDALRGFAVMAILLVHNVEHFILPVYPTNSPAWLNALDAGTTDVIFALFGGKAYAIFSLLFGFTFSIQYANQKAKERDFGYRFLWRLVGLAIFASLNALFFPAGDVLLLYAVMGIVLFIVRKWSDLAVLITAIIFLLQPMEWLHYILSLINPAHQLPDYGVGAMYAEVAEISKNGSLGEFLWCNITLGQKASLMWAVGAGRLFQTAGLFLLGLYIGRKELFVINDKNLCFWTTMLIISAISFTPLFSLRNMLMEAEGIIPQTAGTAFDMWQKFAFTAVLVSSFMILYQREKFQKLTSALKPYGRMSLTNYISQSAIGCLIYFPLGLYLAPYCGATLSLIIGIAVFLLQVQFCKWWFKSHRQGPLESLWHRWTWFGKNSR